MKQYNCYSIEIFSTDRKKLYCFLHCIYYQLSFSMSFLISTGVQILRIWLDPFPFPTYIPQWKDMIILILPILLFVTPPIWAVKCPLLEVSLSNTSSGDFGGVYKLTNTKTEDPRERVYEHQSKDRWVYKTISNYGW